MSIAMVSSPLGIIGGYGLTYLVMKRFTWEFSFQMQGAIVMLFSLFFGLAPKKYTEIDEVQRLLKEERKRRKQHLPEVGGTGNLQNYMK